MRDTDGTGGIGGTGSGDGNFSNYDALGFGFGYGQGRCPMDGTGPMGLSGGGCVYVSPEVPLQGTIRPTVVELLCLLITTRGKP